MRRATRTSTAGIRTSHYCRRHGRGWGDPHLPRRQAHHGPLLRVAGGERLHPQLTSNRSTLRPPLGRRIGRHGVPTSDRWVMGGVRVPSRVRLRPPGRRQAGTVQSQRRLLGEQKRHRFGRVFVIGGDARWIEALFGVPLVLGGEASCTASRRCAARRLVRCRRSARTGASRSAAPSASLVCATACPVRARQRRHDRW
jgi:hypothetical protein